MAKAVIRNGTGSSRRGAMSTSKYDAHNKVLSQTYGALADLRRELSDSKSAVAEREELLRTFALCADSQRAWLLLEDYFEKLSLSRKDFPAADWWPRMLAAQNKEMENWLFPPKPMHLDTPRASLRVICRPQPDGEHPGQHRLAVQFHLIRPRTGEKVRSLQEILELTTRAAHEQELFAPADWDFIQWLVVTHHDRKDGDETLVLTNVELLHWLARWGHTSRLESEDGKPLHFPGHVAELTPHLENGTQELSFTHRLTLPDGQVRVLSDTRFFSSQEVRTIHAHSSAGTLPVLI